MKPTDSSTPVDTTPMSPTTRPTNTDNISNVTGIGASTILTDDERSDSINPAPASDTDKNKHKLTLIVLVIVFLLVLCAILGIFIFQLVSGGGFSGGSLLSDSTAVVDGADAPNNGSGNSSTDSGGSGNNPGAPENDITQSHLTLELVKSVCEKYGGELTAASESNIYLYGAEAYYCIDEKSPAGALSNGSQIIVGFIDDNKKDEVWSRIRSAISDSEGHEDVSGYVILEDSDTFIKAYATIAGLVREYIVAYGNAVVEIGANSDHAVEEILTELGFPIGKRAADYR